MSADLCFAPVTELASRLRSRKLSPVELTRQYLDRIRSLDPRLGAFVTVTADQALQEASRAEVEIGAGRYRGELHGVPYAVKDLVATKGIRTTWGSRLFADQIPDHDATVIERLRAAGAVLLGKLSMNELGAGPPGADWNGPVRNPWKLDHWTHGSSTGPAAAVAGGLAAFAIASETTSSVLGPASACGIVGFRPTYGRVSRYGVMPLSWTMDKVGPMARRVADCATVFRAIHGADPRDPTSINAPFEFRRGKRPTGCRLGMVREEFEQLRGPGADAPYRSALDVLRGLDLALEEVELPKFPYREVSSFIWQVESFSVFEPYARDGRLQRALLNKDRWIGWKAAAATPASDYMKVLRIRHAIARAASELTGRCDVLVAPINPLGARPIQPAMGGEPAGRPALTDNLLRLGALAGLPAVTVPCGFTPSGLPVGLAFVGRQTRDDIVCRIAHAFEQATEWRLLRPAFRE
ncbi:MAG: amidase [Bryobacteraceae bacterium]